jgi:hypothetical protein
MKTLIAIVFMASVLYLLSGIKSRLPLTCAQAQARFTAASAPDDLNASWADLKAACRY